jgi:hypothetical protein
LNEAVSILEQQKTQREVELEELKEKSENLSDDIIDLRCKSMSYNLIFNGIEETLREDTEEVLHNFLNQELGIDFHFEFTNVHRFGKKNRKKPSKLMRPIVAQFINQKDVSFVLENARKLKGKPFRINHQFPEEIEQARKCLYPIMKALRQRGEHVKLLRDILNHTIRKVTQTPDNHPCVSRVHRT